MRHGHGLRKLNRTSAHRQAMLRNMATSLIEHEIIRTTLPKAKELRRVIEPLITLAKEDSVAHRRLAYSRLSGRQPRRDETGKKIAPSRAHQAVIKLFTELGPRFKECPGGYTRILKMGFRVGDAAPMALVELLDRPDGSAAAPEQPQAAAAAE